jgi:hypothetical protein
MINKSTRIADTARALLTTKAARGNHLVRPLNLPIDAGWQLVCSLFTVRLSDEVPAADQHANFAWRTRRGQRSAGTADEAAAATWQVG